MNLFELLNTNDIKIIITDKLETVNNIKNIYNNNIYFILINNHDVVDDKKIFQIYTDINIKYPLLPLSGNNHLINNYAEYILNDLPNNKIENINIIFNKISDIFKEILSLSNILLNINIDEYLNDSIPTHLLYTYYNLNNLFMKFNCTIRDVPFEYLYINDLYIQRSHNFEYNYKYNKMLTAEKEFWCGIPKENIDDYFLNFDKNRKINIIDDDDNLYVILNHAHGWYNFGEFLDAFQKLYIINKLNLDINKIKLVMHSYSRVIDIKKYLYNLGYTHNNFFYINDHDTYHFNKCLFIPLQCYPCRMTKITKSWFANKQLNAINLNINTKTRLYLNRNNYHCRKVLNNDEVLKILEPYNFTILNGDENLELIINLFKNAEMIIGGHGSLFRNNIYCKNKPLIIEFCSKNRKDYSFFDLSHLGNIPHLHFLSECDEENNIIIDLEILQKYLNKL